MRKTERRAIFFDRDGTIIYDLGYLRDPKQVQLLPGVGKALSSLKREGFYLVLVSNQSGVGRGLITLEDAERVHQHLVSLLTEHGTELDGAYYCYHAPWEQCVCRKPSPALLFKASQELRLHLKRSFMIGDKIDDIEAGKNAGCQTILMDPNKSGDVINPAPSYIASNWLEVIDYILSHIKET